MRQLATMVILLLTTVVFAQDKTNSSGLMFSAGNKVEKVWTGGNSPRALLMEKITAFIFLISGIAS